MLKDKHCYSNPEEVRVGVRNKCDRILETHMNSGAFMHVFNDISIYAYVFLKHFLNTFSIEFHVRSITYEIS